MKQIFFMALLVFLTGCADFKGLSLREKFDLDKKGLNGQIEIEEKF